MITEIGIVAGDIWHYLDEKGQASLASLVKGIGKSRELTLMSLGWLAREGHVNLREESGDYRISLNSKG